MENEGINQRLKVLNKVEGLKLPQLDDYVNASYISCGEDYSFIIDTAGQAYSFGLNKNGQLGLGHQTNIEKPVKIPALEGYSISMIKSCGDVNFAITNTGSIFMWPWNDVEAKINYFPLLTFLKSRQINKVNSSYFCDNSNISQNN